MNTTRKTYLVDEEIKTLVYQETYDSSGNVIHSVDYSDSSPVESLFEFNSNNQLVKQIEKQDGIENSSQQFIYDEEGEIVDEKLFIGGALYEHTILEKNNSGFVRKMIQDGEEIERLEKLIEGDNWKNRFYYHNELQESQDYLYNAKELTGTVTIHNYEEDFIQVIKEKYDSNEMVILKEIYNENGKLLSSTETEIKNKWILTEKVQEFKYPENHYRCIYEYDNNNNLIRLECRSLTESLLSFHNRRFDDKNRIVEETGLRSPVCSAIMNGGYLRYYNQFHIIHEYDVSA